MVIWSGLLLIFSTADNATPEQRKAGLDRLNQRYQQDLDLEDIRINAATSGSLRERWRLFHTWQETNRRMLELERQLRTDLLPTKSEDENGIKIEEIIRICRRQMVSETTIRKLIDFICFNDKLVISKADFYHPDNVLQRRVWRKLSVRSNGL